MVMGNLQIKSSPKQNTSEIQKIAASQNSAKAFLLTFRLGFFDSQMISNSYKANGFYKEVVSNKYKEQKSEELSQAILYGTRFEP
jgi:hypothetical protein